MDSLYDKFVDLQAELKKEIKEKISRDEVKLSELIDYVNDYVKPTEYLNCQSFDELMKKVDNLHDFLNCQITVAIAKKFASSELLNKFQVHSKAAKQFRSSQPIKTLREGLKNIYDPHIHDLANAPKAHIDLNSAWDTVTIDRLYTLIKCFFPKSDQQSLLKNIKITSSSVHITYYMTESSSQIIADIKEKISFMHLIGIYGFKVNGHVILPDQHEDVNFTFESGLLNATLNGNNEAVQFLLDLGVNVDCTEQGITTLMLATECSHELVVQTLISGGANVNIQDSYGWTALMLASKNGHFQVAELLLNKEADVHISNNNGWTALMIASQNGHFQVTKLLLSKQANVNLKEIDGWTALMLASHYGHFQVTELLLNKQANVNHTANDGSTALMLASQTGHFQVAELLLNKQGDVNHTTSDGWTALMLASKNGHFQVAELLLNKQTNVNNTANNGATALMFASKNGHFQVAELLLNKQANVNNKANNGATALILASKNGHFQIVELLLDANASPIVTDSYGTEISSLLVAVYNNSPDTVDVLLSKVEFPTDHIMRAFILACYGGYNTLINTLIDKIIDLPQKELLFSCVKGDLAAVISTIVESELNPDTPLVCGLTPLMIATSCGHIELIDALIQAGADVNTCNDYGNNALDIAEGTFNKQQDVIPLLLVNGAVHNIPTDIVIDEFIFHSQNIPPHQLQHQPIEEVDTTQENKHEENRPFIASYLTRKYFMK